MIRSFKTPVVVLALLAAWLGQPSSVQACAVCYGESNSPLAIGLNWGIAVLLGVVLIVLGTIAGFFFYLAKRSQTALAPGASAQPFIDRTQT